MGKFERKKELLTKKQPTEECFVDGIWRTESSLDRKPTPITRQQSFSISRSIALKMIQRFRYRKWMAPYLTPEEKAEYDKPTTGYRMI
jgi:hypothetical protein